VRRQPSTRGLVGLVVAALCVAGCGSEAQRRPAPQPTLPRAIAAALADRSDTIGDALDSGDPCRALALARDLRRQTIAAINGGRVPRPFQEPLQSAVNDLAARIACVQEPKAEAEDDRGEARGKGKGKGKGKKKHHKEHG
jgi:hypothetical protein